MAVDRQENDDMAPLAYTRAGTGEPLVLLHGIGSWRHAWQPVLPALTGQFDVIAVDLPGFGDSEPLPARVEPHPAALAAKVGELLDHLGVAAPHVVGNSLGGWVALELAGVRPVASLTLLSPAGLSRGTTPGYCLFSLRASRWFASRTGRLLSRVVGFRLGRGLVLGQTHGRPFHISADYARAVVRAMGTCPGFDAALRATARQRYRSDTPITAPMTVAFGTRDLLLLPRQSRHLDELPAGTRCVALSGCGHVPMADRPLEVAAVVADSARSGRPA
jgi:pimeloyl-ACP methyl ester carboxylesterase